MTVHRSRLQPDSWVVSAGRPSVAGEPLNAPLVAASNFLLGGHHGYARDGGTPTWEALEELLGGLEGGTSVAFSSGMAAVAAVFDQLRTGSQIVIPEDCYQGVVGLATDGESKGRWSLTRLPLEDTEAWLAACAWSDLIWLESPSNPLLTVGEVDRICAAPRKAGAMVAVDNTFATPLNQQPLELGASVSVQSATKFIGGHSDLLSGVVTTRDDALLHALRKSRSLAGATPGTLESFLAVRGARTLAVRLHRAQNNAQALAERLQSHSRVQRVRYPGLPSHPTHETAKRTLRGFGSIISFEVLGGATAADDVCRQTSLIRHATSLGAVESTMERRAAHPGQEHVPPALVRLSVGIENLEDLWADLDSALKS